MNTLNPVSKATVWTSFTLALAGLGVSIYLTYAHFEKVVLSCPTNGVFNCELVTHSKESYFLGVPVAVLGLLNFVVVVALCSPWAWRRPERVVAYLRGAVAVVNIAMVLWLLAAELLIIGKFCLWCTSVHLITFALFVTLARAIPAQFGWGTTPRP